MDIRRVVALAGPNIWTNYKALEAWVDIGKFEDFPSNTLPGFPDRIMEWLPSMIEHRCGIGERGGFFQRLRTGTYLGHILEHVTIELQSLAGVTVDFGRARETSERGVYKVVIEFTEENFARAAMDTAKRLIMAAVDDTTFDVNEEVRKLRALADEICLGPGTRSIIKAAANRNIPATRLNAGSLVQLGYCSAQRRIWAAETDGTSAVAESIAQDKQLTRQLLQGVGVPVPQGRAVASRDEAWEAAEDIGLPVVIKPQDGNYGRGVSIDLNDEASIKAAYDYADREGSGVVVESMIIGRQHRVLVVCDKVIAANRGDAEHVVGDGIHTIEELVAEANKQPLRFGGQESPLSTLVLDDIALGLLNRQGYVPTSVPSDGEQVVIHYNGDMTEEVSELVHPEVAADCILAANTLGLNIAGIDLIAKDISQPLAAQGGAILEVNASPGLLMHLKPLKGTPRPVGEAIVSALFKPEETGRVPIVAVTGTNGKTSTVALLEHILAVTGKKVGVACSEGVRVEGRPIANGECSDSPSARRLLMNPFIDAVVLEVSAASVLNQGLAVDQCQVAVVTNLGSGDHLGAKYVETLEVMTKVKRTPVDVVLPTGAAVLNADDAVIAGLSKYCPGDTILFGRFSGSETLKSAIAEGRRVVTVEKGTVVLVHGGKPTTVLPVSAIPHTIQGKLGFQVENALAAIAAAWSLGVAPKQIVEGLAKAAACQPSLSMFTFAGATIVISRCRNLSALDATLSVLGIAETQSRRVAIYGVHNDIREEDARAQGVRLGQEFDELILGTYFRAETPEPNVLLQALEAGAHDGGRAQSLRCVGALESSTQITETMRSLKTGQLLLVQAQDANDMTAVCQAVEAEGAHRLALEPSTASTTISIESAGA